MSALNLRERGRSSIIIREMQLLCSKMSPLRWFDQNSLEGLGIFSGLGTPCGGTEVCCPHDPTSGNNPADRQLDEKKGPYATGGAGSKDEHGGELPREQSCG